MLPEKLEDQVKHHNFQEPYRQMFGALVTAHRSLAAEVQLMKLKLYCGDELAKEVNPSTAYPGFIPPKSQGFSEDDVGTLPAGTAADREAKTAKAVKK